MTLVKQCKMCKKKGVFLQLSSNGYCIDCLQKLRDKRLAAEHEEARKKEIADREAQKEALEKALFEQKEHEEARKRFLAECEEQAKAMLNALPSFSIALSDEKRKRQTGYEAPIYSNITAKTKADEFIVFDTETTGLSPAKDRILEIGAIKFKDGAPVEKFHTYINPGRPIPEDASAINKITDEMVSDSPTISQILPTFEAFLGESPLVAHNMEFDLKFLYYSGSYILDGVHKYFDTCEQASRFLKKPKYKFDRELEEWVENDSCDYDVDNYKLETLCDYYSIVIPGKHSALADALATGHLFLKFIEEKR